MNGINRLVVVGLSVKGASVAFEMNFYRFEINRHSCIYRYLLTVCGACFCNGWVIDAIEVLDV
jgi:hypothetical protein